MPQSGHPIFDSPLAIDSAPEAVDTPGWFRASDPGLPSKLATHRLLLGESPLGGVLANGTGFLDSPDCEFIATGMSSKTARHAAVARQGRYLLFGFGGGPSDWTETGRRLFLNALSYCHSFRNDPVQVRTLGIPRAYSQVSRGMDFVRYEHPQGFVIDEDCAALGLANADLAMLDALVGRLTLNPGDALALRLCERYLPQAPADDLAAWVTKHRSKLFFSEWGGYQWRVDCR